MPHSLTRRAASSVFGIGCVQCVIGWIELGAHKRTRPTNLRGQPKCKAVPLPWYYNLPSTSTYFQIGGSASDTTVLTCILDQSRSSI
jgi:hypothetical protein